MKVIQRENRAFFGNITKLTERLSSFLKKNIRFVYPVLIVVLVKLLSSMFLYYSLNLGSTDIGWLGAYGQNLPPSSRWPFLYIGWDSGWYLGNVYYGYNSLQRYAFFPGYPISIYLFNLVIRDLFASLVLSSIIFGVAWIPFFQAIAEHYMTREAASRTTLLTAFFPYVFLFTTVAYSESLFLFATVASWYFYLNREKFKTSLLAAVATITRMVGIIIVLPMFLDMLSQRERKRLLYFLVPTMALFSWLAYCFINTGDWLASITAQDKYWNMYTFPRWLIYFVSTRRMIDAPSEIAGVILIILTCILIYCGRGVDWRLTIYSVASFLVILYFAAMWSITRYLSFIFPIWIFLGTRALQHKRSNILTAALCIAFLPIALLLWYRFLNMEWVA
jgi:hypothetical protein